MVKESKSITVLMRFEKETKGAIRYQETDREGSPVEAARAVIGTLYVRKSGIEGMPMGLSVIITPVE